MNDQVTEESKGQILIYQAENGKISLDVRLDNETVWLTQQRMPELFQTTQQNISSHIINIYIEGELPGEATNKKFLLVQKEGNREVKRLTDYYNLDMIISVGYRISSKRAVVFRQWATQVLREHLTKGYTINQQRFETNARELEAALQLIKKTAQRSELSADAGRGLVEIVTRYAQTFLWLQRYDEGLLIS